MFFGNPLTIAETVTNAADLTVDLKQSGIGCCAPNQLILLGPAGVREIF